MDDSRNFLMSFLLATLLHAMGLYYFTTTLERGTTEIPFNAVNIELGEGKVRITSRNEVQKLLRKQEQAEKLEAAAKQEEAREEQILKEINEAAVNNVKPIEHVAVPLAPKPSTIPAAKPAPTPQSMQSDYQNSFDEGESEEGEGNEEIAEISPIVSDIISEKEQNEIVVRYEQLISLWMDKNKEYPLSARAANITGEAVIRIQINRQGDILNYGFEKRTGAKDLDAAVIRMVEAASPVPKVPENYPEGEVIEFLIPIRFSLD